MHVFVRGHESAGTAVVVSRLRRARWIAVPVLLALCMAEACGSGSTGTTSTVTVTVGTIVALTGGGAAYGSGSVRGAQAAIDEINGRGGIKVGGTAYKLALDTIDDQGDPTRSLTDLKQLSAKGERFFIGPTTGSSATAMLTVADSTNALLTFIGGPATSANIRPHANVYQTQTSGEDLAIATGWYLGSYRKDKSVVLIADQTSTTQATDFKEAFQTASSKYGFTIPSVQYTQGAKQTDFYPQLLAANNAHPDAVVLAQQYTATALMAKQAKQLGYGWQIVSNAGAAAQETDIAGDAINGTFDLTGVNVVTMAGNGNKQARDLMTAYQSKYNEPLQDLAGTFSNCYAAIYAYAQAIQAAGTVKDVKKLEKAMNAVTLSSLPSVVREKYIAQRSKSATFYDASKTAKAKMSIVVWTAGKPQLVTSYTGQ